MDITLNIGRTIGILMLVQIAGGISVNFFLTAPLFGSPGFLVNGVQYANQIGLAVLLGLLVSGLTVAIASLLLPVIWRQGQSLALGYLALAVAGLAVSALEYVNLMSLVSFSQAYAAASGTEQETLGAIRAVVAASRNWAHYVNLVLSGATLLVFYTMFFRFRLIPRLMAALGLLAAALQLLSVSLPLFGRGVVFPMLAPLALVQVAVALWLIVKGLDLSSCKTESQPREFHDVKQ